MIIFLTVCLTEYAPADYIFEPIDISVLFDKVSPSTHFMTAGTGCRTQESYFMVKNSFLHQDDCFFLISWQYSNKCSFVIFMRSCFWIVYVK